ncbi:MAG TPA: hypothetical protein VK619_10255 [Pyrinomonadaceae bacterium]|nr:hypothetical protein [Pyrinomonadaceae bacterium]
MPELLTHPTFSEQLNTKFRIRFSESQIIEVELVEVSELKLSRVQERFSILFRAPVDALFRQGLFGMEHEQMGAFELFLVPVFKEKDGIYYEAVFNRLLERD